MSVRRRVLACALALALAAPAEIEFARPAAATPTVADAASKRPRCDDSQRGGSWSPYRGPSASRVYDRLFRPGPRMPHLNGYVPQGLTTWRNWDGRGSALLLLGMYRTGRESYLVGIDARSGRHVGTVRIYESKLGGIGVIGGWLVAQHNRGGLREQSVRRYRVEAVRWAMLRAKRTGTKPYIRSYGNPQRIPAVSFMNVAEDSLWIGRHDAKQLTQMYRYRVGKDGLLRRVAGPWKVPPRTQGVLVTPRHFLFASSDGPDRGRLRTYRRTAPRQLGVPLGCVWTPSLPQNLTSYDGALFLAFESGSHRFDRPGTRNRIATLHVAPLDAVVNRTTVYRR